MWNAKQQLQLLEYRGNKKERCVICHEIMTGGTKKLNPCRHQFHRKCIAKWVQTGKTTCPWCINKIESTQLQELRGNILEIEYGHQISQPLPHPQWEQNPDDCGNARGNLFQTENKKIKRALSYLVLIQYMKKEYFVDGHIHEDTTPETSGYHDIMWAAQLEFDVDDWSETLLPYNDANRPPFIILQQQVDDNGRIELESLQISEDAFVDWWNINEESIIHEFNEITSRV